MRILVKADSALARSSTRLLAGRFFFQANTQITSNFSYPTQACEDMMNTILNAAEESIPKFKHTSNRPSSYLYQRMLIGNEEKKKQRFKQVQNT